MVSKSESPTKENIWYGIDEYVHKYQVCYVTEKKYSCHKSNRQQYFQAVIINVMTDFFFFLTAIICHK